MNLLVMVKNPETMICRFKDLSVDEPWMALFSRMIKRSVVVPIPAGVDSLVAADIATKFSFN